MYQATHRGLGSPVALKVLVLGEALLAEDQARRVETFHAEARILARLDHPAVARALDHGATGVNGQELLWIAMEWIDGLTLDAALDARGRSPLAPREALKLLRPVLEGVAAAHALGIAHRDLKPANVMLAATARGPDRARLVDFGVAKLFDAERGAGDGVTRTESERSAFSFAYASPEQLGRARTGPWTDVHALGLLLVELLVGRPAYDASDPIALAGQILDPERPTPARAGVAVGALEPVLARALALRPADRYADAGALLAALDRAVEAAPPRAARAPDVRRGLASPGGRLAGGAWVAAVALLSLVALGATWQRATSAPTPPPRAPPPRASHSLEAPPTPVVAPREAPAVPVATPPRRPAAPTVQGPPRRSAPPRSREIFIE
ncbi:MAG: serine/threonine protein kinase [Deltaproteobacteria bacterium]|nr:serine/threonine protein kinase [Deltaproteobacteria bacterium]